MMILRRSVSALLTVALVIASAAAALAAEKKRAKKAKEYDYENSKYKSYKVLVDEPRTYRFDERGNPIPPPDDKKAKSKKKKRALPPMTEEPPAKPDCEETDTCQADEPKELERPAAGQAP